MTAPTTAKTMTDAILEAARSATAVVNVALPATVVAYDDATQKATIRLVPQFRRKNPANNNVPECYDPPDLPGIPVAFPGSGGFSITWPLAAGDSGLLVVSDRSMDEWLSAGGTRTTPRDARRHNLTDGVFMPGLRAFATPIPAAGVDGTAMVARATEIRLGSATASDFVALQSLVETELNKILNLLQTWTVVPMDGGAALKVAANLLTIGSVGASKVKAE